MPRPVELQRWVPDDNSGIRLIMREHMVPRILESARLSQVYLFANAFARERQHQEAEALLYWLRGHMIYTPDPPNEEYIKWPSVLLDEIRRHGHALGDCDDYVILYATLAVARDIPTRLVVIARQPVDDGSGEYQFDHIYTELELDGEWTPVDPSGDVAMGWEFENPYYKEVFDVS